MNIKFLSLLTLLLVFISAISKADGLLHEKLKQSRKNGYKTGFANEYRSGFDNQVMLNQVRSAFLESKFDSVTKNDWDMLSIYSKVNEYQGKRLRYSCYVKTENVQEKALLWFRIDSNVQRLRNNRTTTLNFNPATLAFDNMTNRPIIGTTDWTKHSIALDVAEEAYFMHFGLILNGRGKVWINDCKVEIVGKDIPVTDMYPEMIADKNK